VLSHHSIGGVISKSTKTYNTASAALIQIFVVLQREKPSILRQSDRSRLAGIRHQNAIDKATAFDDLYAVFRYQF